MAMLEVEPGFAERLRRWGLDSFAALAALPAVVVGCHPARRVARVTLGAGPDAVSAFLKRETRVSWRERLANWWAGFGLVSRSVREARVLCQARAAGIGCPEILAAGESDGSEALLLVRTLSGFVELRRFLPTLPSAARRRFARALGRSLARLHAAGFDHPDLYSKHILIHPQTQDIAFLDWQRSRRRHRLGRRHRCRDLAALDATLAADLVAARERLACLRSYLRASGIAVRHLPALAARIQRVSRRLQGKRRIRELCQEPLPLGAQSLVPMEGGSILADPELLADASADLLNVLRLGTFPPGAKDHLEQRLIGLADGGQAFLVRRRVHRPRGWLWAWLRGKPLLSSERRQADAIYRLQRHGVAVARLLAYGQRQTPPWRQESLLLVETPGDSLPLTEWLIQHPDVEARQQMLADAANLLRRMHAAGIYLGTLETLGSSLLVKDTHDEPASPGLGTVEGLIVRRRPCERLAHQDRKLLQNTLEWAMVGEESRCAASGRVNPDEMSIFDEDSGTPPADGILSEMILSTNHGAEA